MQIIDQYRDPHFEKMAAWTQDAPAFSKFASSFGEAPKEAHAYAWPEAETFPVHTPQDAVFSLMYASKQASKVPVEVYCRVKEAVEAYGLNADEIIATMNTPLRVKEAAADEYLLPKHRRLLVKTAEDVHRASRALARGADRLDAATMAEAAIGLVKKAAEHEMASDLLPPFIYKYAGLVQSDPARLVDWLEARAAACDTLEHREMYDKIAQVVFDKRHELQDRAELIKLSSMIGQADKLTGLDTLYGQRFDDPILTVFNTEKIAEPSIDLGNGMTVATRQLMTIPPEVYADTLGDDFVAQVSSEQGLDPDLLEAIIPTLPADMKQQFMAAVAPYLS